MVKALSTQHAERTHRVDQKPKIEIIDCKHIVNANLKAHKKYTYIVYFIYFFLVVFVVGFCDRVQPRIATCIDECGSGHACASEHACEFHIAKCIIVRCVYNNV